MECVGVFPNPFSRERRGAPRAGSKFLGEGGAGEPAPLRPVLVLKRCVKCVSRCEKRHEGGGVLDSRLFIKCACPVVSHIC